MSRFYSRIITLFGIIICIPVFAHGSEVSPHVISRINIENCTITQNERDIQVVCDFVNGGSFQGDIKYALEIVGSSESRQFPLDKHVYEDSFILDQGQRLQKQMPYRIPDYAEGDVQIWVKASNSDGFPLAQMIAGTIAFNGDASGVFVDTRTCYVVLDGDDKPTKYAALYGIDIGVDENLVATCTAHNLDEKAVTLNLQVDTYERNMFGEYLNRAILQSNPVMLALGESKEFSFLLPKETKPQAYDAVVRLVQNGTPVSNMFTVHYVIQGSSATIQNLALDNSFYDAGAKALAEIYWSGSADSFPASRAGDKTYSAAFARATINSGSALCGTAEAAVDKSSSELSVEVPITTDCYDPVLDVSLMSEGGEVLASKTLSLTSENRPAEKQKEARAYLMFIVSGFGAFLLGCFTFWIIRRKKKKANTEYVTPNSLGIFLLISLVGSVFFFSVVDIASADTFSGTQTGTVNTVSLSKTVVSPGETFIATYVHQYDTCLNGMITGCVTLGMQNPSMGQSWSQFLPSQGSGMCGWPCIELVLPAWDTYSTTFTAPTTPGTYTVIFYETFNYNYTTYTCQAGYNQATASHTMTYTVGGPNNPPSVSVSGPTSGTVNTAYTFNFTANDPEGSQVQYGVDWDNNGSVDQGNPYGNPMNSGQTLGMDHSWPSAGIYTFRYWATDVNGAASGDRTHAITISAPPPTTTFEVSVNSGAWSAGNPPVVDTNDTIALRWSSTGATNCTGTNFNTGGATSNGGTNVTTPAPGGSTTFTLTCTGLGGTDAKSITVQAGLPNFNRPIATHNLSTTFNPTTGEYTYVDLSFQTTNDGQSGTANTAPYSVQFDSRTPVTGTIPLLTRGSASPNFTHRLNTIPFGNHTATIVVDTNNSVAETNEGDNTYVYTFGGVIPPPDPQISITADRIQLRNNETTIIRWTTVGTYPTLVCQVTGPGMNVNPAPFTGSQTTQPITAKSEYTFRCTETTTNTTWSDAVVVETQGVIEEI